MVSVANPKVLQFIDTVIIEPHFARENCHSRALVRTGQRTFVIRGSNPIDKYLQSLASCIYKEIAHQFKQHYSTTTTRIENCFSRHEKFCFKEAPCGAPSRTTYIHACIHTHTDICIIYIYIYNIHTYTQVDRSFWTIYSYLLF